MDRKNIEMVVKNYIQAIHTQEKDAFMSLFTIDASLISVTKCYQGVESIYNDFVIGAIRKSFSEIDLISEDINIRLVSDDLAIVIFKYHTECIKRDTHEKFGIQGFETQILVKYNDEWKIEHIHYSK